MKGISLENFPFDDAPNTAVITCCHVLDRSLPLLHVSHDMEDGMWQFLCGRCHDEAEARIVSLYSIYMHDPSIARACLKNAFRQMCVTICGRFAPNEGRITGYVT